MYHIFTDTYEVACLKLITSKKEYFKQEGGSYYFNI